MRKSILVILTIAGLQITAQSKADVEVTYHSTLIKDSLNRTASIETDNVLLYNSSESVFYTRNEKDYYEALRDGKPTAGIQTSFGTIPRYPKNGGQVYRKGDKVITTLKLGFYNYEFPEPSLAWEILPETKKIKDISCQKAKTITDSGDVFYAWFAPEIVSTEGPFRFKGLAGLIMDVYNANNTIHFEAIEIKKSSEDIEKIPYLNVLTLKSKDQFKELRTNFIENPSIYMGDMQVLDANGNDITRKKMERYKKQNVFLD